MPSPIDGILSEIVSKDGSTVEVGALLGSISQNGSAPSPKQPQVKKEPEIKKENNVVNLETPKKKEVKVEKQKE